MPPCSVRLRDGLPGGSTSGTEALPRSRTRVYEIDVSNDLFLRSVTMRFLLIIWPPAEAPRSEKTLRQSRPLISRQAWDLDHGSNLDGPLARHGNPCRDVDGFVEMFGVDEEVAT